MKQIFFPTGNRITRRSFWTAQIAYLAVNCLLAVVGFIIGHATNESTTAGDFSVNGASALPMVAFSVLASAVQLTLLVSAIKVAIKRFHDRDKGGAWVFIILVPIVGQVWYLVETGFLAGTPGPNRFGPSPLPGVAQLTDQGFSLAR